MLGLRFYELTTRVSRTGFAPIAGLVAILFAASTVVSQVVKQDEQKKEAEREEAERRYLKWQSRVTDLTEGSVRDSSALSTAERAMYLSLLAKIWWKTDEREARVFLKKASAELIGSVKLDDSSEVKRQFKYIQRTLEIISELDARNALDLTGKLISAFDIAATGKSNVDQELAELIVGLGLRIAKSNATLAYECGRDSLKFGFASGLPSLVVELNLTDGLLADSLLKQTLLRAKGNYTHPSYLLLSNLSRYMAEFNKGKPFSPESHRSVLGVFAEMLGDAAAVEYLRPARCKIGSYVPRLLPRFDEFIPVLSVTVRQNFQTCLPYTSESGREKTRADGDESPKTVDDILRAARETNDTELKIAYFRRAFSTLKAAKDYEELTSILDGLDGDEYKKISPIGWDDWRIDAAFNGALRAFESEDLPTIYRFIDKTPKLIRPHVRNRLASNSLVAKNKQFYLENLDELQKEINQLGFPFHEAARLFLRLSQYYLSVRSTDSEVMFRTSAKYINKADGENPDLLLEKDWAPMSEYVSLNSQLIDLDEISISLAIKDIGSPRSRLRLRLGLLESSLKDLTDAKKVVVELNKGLSKSLNM